MGKVRKGKGGRVIEDKTRKPKRPVKTSRQGQVIWCENCRAKDAHKDIREVVLCFDRYVREGEDFFWVRAS
jgi:hypothetical protein